MIGSEEVGESAAGLFYVPTQPYLARGGGPERPRTPDPTFQQPPICSNFPRPTPPGVRCTQRGGGGVKRRQMHRWTFAALAKIFACITFHIGILT